MARDQVVPAPEADFFVPNEGPKDGHRFRFTVHSCMASGVIQPDNSVGDYKDADYWDVSNTVEVRASSLADAIEQLSQVPFSGWMGEGMDLRRAQDAAWPE